MGCNPEQITEQLTDANSTTQGIVEDVNTALEIGQPVVKVIEKTPWGLPVSAVFNGISLVVASLYGLRDKQSRASVEQMTVAQQAAKSLLPEQARKILATANGLVQSPQTAGFIKTLKADNTHRSWIEEVKGTLAVNVKAEGC